MGVTARQAVAPHKKKKNQRIKAQKKLGKHVRFCETLFYVRTTTSLGSLLSGEREGRALDRGGNELCSAVYLCVPG